MTSGWPSHPGTPVAPRTLVFTALLLFVAAASVARPPVAEPESCDSVSGNPEVQRALNRQFSTLSPEDRYWATYAIGGRRAHDPPIPASTLYDTVVARTGRSGLHALLEVILDGAGIPDRAIGMLTVFSAGAVLQARPDGVSIADSGLTVLAQRLADRRIADDYFLMWGLLALARVPPAAVEDRRPTPGSLAALCGLRRVPPAGATATGPDYEAGREVILAHLFLRMEEWSSAWSAAQTGAMLASWPDAADAAAISERMAQERAGRSQWRRPSNER
jgi:hypothetical protein